MMVNADTDFNDNAMQVAGRLRESVSMQEYGCELVHTMSLMSRGMIGGLSSTGLTRYFFSR